MIHAARPLIDEICSIIDASAAMRDAARSNGNSGVSVSDPRLPRKGTRGCVIRHRAMETALFYTHERFERLLIPSGSGHHLLPKPVFLSAFEPLKALQITPAEFHGEWNSSIQPRR
jgi:hypothetical protein